jgi:hypothetical protein
MFPSPRGRQVETIAKPGQVRADGRISREEPGDLPEGRDQFLASTVSASRSPGAAGAGGTADFATSPFSARV